MVVSEKVLAIRARGKQRIEAGREALFEKRAVKYAYATGPVGSANGMLLALAVSKDLGKTYAVEAGDAFDDVVDGVVDGKLPDASTYFNPALRPTYVKRKTNANEGSWLFVDVEFADDEERTSHEALAIFLDHAQDDPQACLISGALHPHLDSKRQHKRRWHASARRDGKVGGAIVPRVGYWRQLEIDKLQLPDGMTAHDFDKVIAFVAQYLEPIIGKVSFVYQFSSSHGVGGPDDDKVSVHIWFRSRQLIESRQWHRISQSMQRSGVDIDTAVSVGTAVCFTARPTFEGGDGVDFLGDRRVGVHWSEHDEADLSTWIKREEIAAETRAIRARKRAEEARKLMLTRGVNEIVDAYINTWNKYAAKYLGDGPGRSGYYKSMFAMMCRAVECGAADARLVVPHLMQFVTRFAEMRGELEDRGPGKNPLATYLDHDTLCQRFEDARDKVLGADDDHEQQE